MEKELGLDQSGDHAVVHEFQKRSSNITSKYPFLKPDLIQKLIRQFAMKGHFDSTDSVLSPIPQGALAQCFQASQRSHRNVQCALFDGRDKEKQTEFLSPRYIYFHSLFKLM
jgi:hypothetical protein